MRPGTSAAGALVAGLAAVGLAAPAPTPSGSPSRPRANPARAAAVKSAFEHSWRGYYENAFPHDTLHPVTNGFEDDRAGWGVTVVDALSTAIIMGERRIVDQMLDHIASIDFGTTERENDAISVFETNIRYLGGLLSGYDLLTGPNRYLDVGAGKVAMLLAQARSLADSLSIAFDTASGVPDPTIFLNPTRRTSGARSNNIAEVGTLVLEWTRLSDLTGDGRYAALAQRAEAHLVRPRGAPEAWPGLVGSDVAIADGAFLNSDGGWSGGTDSFYEYLIKMYQYDADAFAEYRDRWVLAADSTMAHLQSHPTTNASLTYLSQYSGNRTIPVSTHLASFAAGNFILGGHLLGRDDYRAFGLALAASYAHNYERTPARIGPEVFRWVDAALPGDARDNAPPPANQSAFYAAAGFYTTAADYILRPETVESLYYAYRLTGDTAWQERAWRAFEAVNATCRAGSAYAQLADVMQPDGRPLLDQMQSFWMAETLKYLYLIFAAESPAQLQLQGDAGAGAFVFSTEAHPLRLRGRGVEGQAE